MEVLLYIFHWIEEPSLLIDIVLTAVLIALIGATGYILFIDSMRKDQEDRASKLYMDNPWDVVSGNTDEPKNRFSRGKLILIIALLAAIALVLFLLLI